MSRPLAAIVELQTLISRLRSAEALLDGIPDWMKELHEEYSAHKSQIEELDEAVSDAAATRRQAESAVADYQEKLKHFQGQIAQVRTQREYGALLQEIDTVKEGIKTSEEEAFAAMERQDAAQSSLDEERKAFEELDRRYAVELEKWEKEKPEVQKKAEALRAEIAELRSQVPRQHLAHFERLLERHSGQALAPIREVERPKGPRIWHCGACNYRVRPQAVVEIRGQEALVECDSCKRLLHYAETAE